MNKPHNCNKATSLLGNTTGLLILAKLSIDLFFPFKRM